MNKAKTNAQEVPVSLGKLSSALKDFQQNESGPPTLSKTMSILTMY